MSPTLLGEKPLKFYSWCLLAFYWGGRGWGRLVVGLAHRGVIPEPWSLFKTSCSVSYVFLSSSSNSVKDYYYVKFFGWALYLKPQDLYRMLFKTTSPAAWSEWVKPHPCPHEAHGLQGKINFSTRKCNSNDHDHLHDQILISYSLISTLTFFGLILSLSFQAFSNFCHSGRHCLIPESVKQCWPPSPQAISKILQYFVSAGPLPAS